MAFVKLDTKILNSTTWLDADACKVFITSLLMAEPYEAKEPIQAIQVKSTDLDEFVVPAGWYGFVPAAGPGIAHRALIEQDRALDALERLAAPDLGSRTPDHEGRRMVRVPGGYLILNYMAHRDKDHSAAQRQARLRERRKAQSNGSNAVIVTPVTHADADADADAGKSKDKARSRANPVHKPDDVQEQTWDDWNALRKAKRAPVTQTVLTEAEREASQAGMTLDEFLRAWCVSGYQGFKADWIPKNGASNGSHSRSSAVDRVRANAIAGEAADRAKSDRGADLVGSHD